VDEELLGFGGDDCIPSVYERAMRCSRKYLELSNRYRAIALAELNREKKQKRDALDMMRTPEQMASMSQLSPTERAIKARTYSHYLNGQNRSVFGKGFFDFLEKRQTEMFETVKGYFAEPGVLPLWERSYKLVLLPNARTIGSSIEYAEQTKDRSRFKIHQKKGNTISRIDRLIAEAYEAERIKVIHLDDFDMSSNEEDSKPKKREPSASAGTPKKKNAMPWLELPKKRTHDFTNDKKN